MKIVLAIAVLFSTSLYASPKEVEFLFLSRPKIAEVIEYLNKKNEIAFFQEVAEKDFDCIPMGEGCFHPQMGFVEDEVSDDAGEEKPQKKEKIKKKDDGVPNQYKTFNATENNMIDCKKDYYFDVYCGKAQKEGAGGDVEIWIDTSSSMKQIDYAKNEGDCMRRALASKVSDECGRSVVVSTFDTARKSIGHLNNTCMNYGLNDGKRVIDWIKGNNARFLLIVSDVDEYNGELRDYIEEIGAKVHGIGTREYYAKDLLSFSDKITSICKKPKKK